MKLYDNYRKIVDEIKPEICWFTSFNLNTILLEKYLLSAICGWEPEDLRRAEDFEGMNLDLIDLNIRVWYDYRALDAQSIKRTTVDLVAVDPSKIPGTNAADAIFHPKVIFLKGKTRSFLISGSANLTIAGWGRNREAMIIKEIECQENARQVIDFFKQLNILEEETKVLDSWISKLPKRSTTWKFAHNFNIQSLPPELNGTELHIWSPYFSRDTQKLTTGIISSGYKKVHLIPDISLSQKLRIIPRELKNILEAGVPSIYRDLTANNELQPLSHAKVWLTENKIAIGSWNYSFRATGVGISSFERNIEAGIIESILPENRNKLIRKLKEHNSENISGTTAEELEQEWNGSLNNYSFCCTIAADWNTLKYELILSEPPQEGLFVSLPHQQSVKTPLKEVNELSFINGFQRVLKNKQFSVFNEKNDLVYSGFLLETAKKYRRAETYVSLFDLFESLALDPLAKTSKARISYQYSNEDGAIANDEEIPYFKYNNYNSYYQLFVAFQNLKDCISANKHSQQKLRDLAIHLPGSIQNIIHLYSASLIKAKEENIQDQLLFHYFLAIEINNCIREINNNLPDKLTALNTQELESILNLTKKDISFIKKANGIQWNA